MIHASRPRLLAAAPMAACALLLCLPATGRAGYTLSTFATSPTGASQPDSIALGGGNVFVGFGNGAAADGSDGKSSTIVEYSQSGQLIRSFSVVGHNDGLRYDQSTNTLWALQNQDGNTKLAIINPAGGSSTVYNLPAPHGGGYDDVVFSNGHAYVSASNPTLNGSGVNTFAAIDSISISGGVATVAPVLKGNASAFDVKTGLPVALNAIDPDSLTVTPTGALLMSNQAANQLVFVNNPGASNQTVGVLGLTHSVDDTAFATSAIGRLLVADPTSGTIYSIGNTGGFAVGAAFSAVQDAGLVSSLDTTTGALTTIFDGLGHTSGMVFDSAVPEPGSVALLATGLVAAVALGRRSLKKPAAPIAS